MATTIKQTESLPEKTPCGSISYSGPDPMAIWQRIDAYVAYRWTPRAVVWIVEGPGEWTPPLTPTTVSTIEVWTGDGWTTTAPGASPLGGYTFDCEGPYRITAEVGGGVLPPAVQQAYDRLARYVSAVDRTPGERLAMRTVSLNRYDERPHPQTPEQDALRVQETDGAVEYANNWPARALQLSGAADLLRPYRRA